MNEMMGAVRSFIEIVAGLAEPWNWIVGYGSIFVILGVLAWRTLKFVKRDKVAIRERLGKPLLKYQPLPGEKSLSRNERKRRKTIDKRLIKLQENPHFGQEVVHGSGPVFINPFVHRLEEVESRERNITIDDFPVVMNIKGYEGETIDVGVTVRLMKACRWRYRNEDIDKLIKQILTHYLYKALKEKGAAWVKDNGTEFIAYFLKSVQTKRPDATRLGPADADLQDILDESVKNDSLSGVLAKYGGYVTDAYLIKAKPMFEGWQPQATVKIAEAIGSSTSNPKVKASILKKLFNGGIPPQQPPANEQL
jgi:regulator of protease activity HflC (stomatin/prohibitin superfamily)